MIHLRNVDFLDFALCAMFMIVALKYYPQTLKIIFMKSKVKISNKNLRKLYVSIATSATKNIFKQSFLNRIFNSVQTNLYSLRSFVT